ncbi:MAG: hypothetical protein KAT71_08075 [Gammaproteobacteria bacterium]|nr:hypothetical protein [Gammaproteobacteria bacterium]
MYTTQSLMIGLGGKDEHFCLSIRQLKEVVYISALMRSRYPRIIILHMKVPDKQILRDSLKISFDGHNRIEVIKPLIYDVGGIVIVVPAGFKSDGVSNPFIRNTLDLRVLAFGILHDYGYRTQFNKSRAFWDTMATTILPITADQYTANTYYVILRVVGMVAWHRNKCKGLERYPEAKELRNKYICKL